MSLKNLLTRNIQKNDLYPNINEDKIYFPFTIFEYSNSKNEHIQLITDKNKKRLIINFNGKYNLIRNYGELNDLNKSQKLNENLSLILT